MSKKNKNTRVRAETDKSVQVMDAFSNPAARIGYSTMDLLQATEYPLTRMTQLVSGRRVSGYAKSAKKYLCTYGRR